MTKSAERRMAQVRRSLQSRLGLPQDEDADGSDVDSDGNVRGLIDDDGDDDDDDADDDSETRLHARLHAQTELGVPVALAVPCDSPARQIFVRLQGNDTPLLLFLL